MSQASSGSPFADVLKQTLELSKQVQASQEAAAEREPVVVERAEGMVQATAKPNGEILVELNPVAVRIGSQVLAEEVTAAVNEALAELRKQQLDFGSLDLEGVNQQVEEIGARASAQLTSFMDGILRAHDAAGGEPVERDEE
ncbi:YbaB/EbfC family nucleoid-associated protein [Glycomyces sp. NPDC047369]